MCFHNPLNKSHICPENENTCFYTKYLTVLIISSKINDDVFRNMFICWLLRPSSLRPNVDNTYTKVRPNFDRCLLETSTTLTPNFDQTSTGVFSKLRPNFDQTSTPPVPKFGRSLFDMRMNHFVKLIKCRPSCDTKLRPNFDTWGVEVPTKLRHPRRSK